MAQTQLKLPYFARGTYEKLQEALDTGIFKNLDRIVWCILTDEEHKDELAFVDVEKNIILMKSDVSAELQPIYDIMQEQANRLSTLENSVEDIQLQLDDYYTKAEIDEMIVQTQSYSKEEIDGMVNELDNRITETDTKASEAERKASEADEKTQWIEI